MGYNAEQMRALLRKNVGGRQLDPNEFRPPKASEGQILKFKFYVLPPYSAGDTIVGGTAATGIDTFFVTDGLHWVESRPHACPRVMSNDEAECEMCTVGFRLLDEVKSSGNDESQRKLVKDQWLPQTNRIVNIWFPNIKSNPEEYRNRVMWFKANTTIFNMWYETAMRDNPGDDQEEPLPFGLFFDENDALLFNFVVEKNKKFKQFNTYESSRFVVRDANGNPANGPIVRKADGSPDAKAIKEILARRHDLLSKREKYDVDAIAKLARRLLDAASGKDGFDADENKPRSSRVAEDDRVVQSRRAGLHPAKAAPSKSVVAESDEDDNSPVGEALADESPLQDEDVPTRQAPKSGKQSAPKGAKTAKATAPAESSESDDADDNPMLAKLLNQLNDDD